MPTEAEIAYGEALRRGIIVQEHMHTARPVIPAGSQVPTVVYSGGQAYTGIAIVPPTAQSGQEFPVEQITAVLPPEPPPPPITRSEAISIMQGDVTPALKQKYVTTEKAALQQHFSQEAAQQRLANLPALPPEKQGKPPKTEYVWLEKAGPYKQKYEPVPLNELMKQQEKLRVAYVAAERKAAGAQAASITKGLTAGEIKELNQPYVFEGIEKWWSQPGLVKKDKHGQPINPIEGVKQFFQNLMVGGSEMVVRPVAQMTKPGSYKLLANIFTEKPEVRSAYLGLAGKDIFTDMYTYAVGNPVEFLGKSATMILLTKGAKGVGIKVAGKLPGKLAYKPTPKPVQSFAISKSVYTALDDAVFTKGKTHIISEKFWTLKKGIIPSKQQVVSIGEFAGKSVKIKPTTIIGEGGSLNFEYLTQSGAKLSSMVGKVKTTGTAIFEKPTILTAISKQAPKGFGLGKLPKGVIGATTSRSPYIWIKALPKSTRIKYAIDYGHTYGTTLKHELLHRRYPFLSEASIIKKTGMGKYNFITKGYKVAKINVNKLIEYNIKTHGLAKMKKTLGSEIFTEPKKGLGAMISAEIKTPQAGGGWQYIATVTARKGSGVVKGLHAAKRIPKSEMLSLERTGLSKYRLRQSAGTDVSIQRFLKGINKKLEMKHLKTIEGIRWKPPSITPFPVIVGGSHWIPRTKQPTMFNMGGMATSGKRGFGYGSSLNDRTLLSNIYIPKERTLIDTSTKSDYISLEKTMVDQSYKSLEKSVLALKMAPLGFAPPPITPRPAPPITPPMLFLSRGEKKRSRIAGNRAGYDVFAKILGRKKRIATNLPKISAMSRGSRYVDTTPAASFMIKKSGKKTASPSQYGWKDLKHKFRRPFRTEGDILPTKNIKAGNIFVEKNRYRIDSMGEMFGLYKAKKAGGYRKKAGIIDTRRAL